MSPTDVKVFSLIINSSIRPIINIQKISQKKKLGKKMLIKNCSWIKDFPLNICRLSFDNLSRLGLIEISSLESYPIDEYYDAVRSNLWYINAESECKKSLDKGDSIVYDKLYIKINELSELFSYVCLNKDILNYKSEKARLNSNASYVEYYDKVSYCVVAKMKEGCITINTRASYTLHVPSGTNLNNINLKFGRDNIRLKRVCFAAPQNPAEYIEIKNPEKIINIEFKVVNGCLINNVVIPIPKPFKGNDTLIINKEFESIEHDHWAIYDLMFDSIMKGIDFTLKIEDESLIIKDFTLFENSKLYKIIRSEKENTLEIHANSWLPRYYGFHILIAKKD